MHILNLLTISLVAASATKWSDARITNREARDEICQDLSSFSAKSVTEFFRRAIPLSPEELHEFDQLDCRVGGTLKRDGRKLDFEIQPIGIGRIKGKTTELFGCRTCDDLFPPKPQRK